MRNFDEAIERLWVEVCAPLAIHRGYYVKAVRTQGNLDAFGQGLSLP